MPRARRWEPLLDDLRAIAQPPKPLEVVILGAGLAGLCAAYELERRGHRVVLLEAETRHVGGHARTLRFEDGLYGEAGAMRIPERHELTRHYVKELGLTLRPFVQSNPKAYYYLRGCRDRIENARALATLYDLQGPEKAKTPDELWADSVGRRRALDDAAKADLSAEAPATATVRSLDQLSLQQLFEGRVEQLTQLDEKALRLRAQVFVGHHPDAVASEQVDVVLDKLVILQVPQQEPAALELLALHEIAERPGASFVHVLRVNRTQHILLAADENENPGARQDAPEPLGIAAAHFHSHPTTSRSALHEREGAAHPSAARSGGARCDSRRRRTTRSRPR